MPRPQKPRRVGFIPDATYFKPAGIPMRVLEEICLSMEEAEAVRLKDLEGLDQEEGARKLNVSRPTFQRILGSARQKIADALLNGKAIKIEGGNFEVSFRRFRCANGHEWDVPFEVMANTPPQFCPRCNTPSITPFHSSELGCRGRRRQRGGEHNW